MICAVLVPHHEIVYQSKWTALKHGFAWKCGQCLHGRVEPKIDTACRVCGAVVVGFDDDGRAMKDRERQEAIVQEYRRMRMDFA